MAEKILVVDDEPAIRDLVAEILLDEGFDVATAEDGETARGLLERFHPHLILLDIWMPDIDGISLLKEWREARKLPGPVVMMSGHGNVETAVEATRLGAYDYLEKPLSLAKLVLTINNALQAYRLQNENIRLRQSSQTATDIIGRSEAITGLREQLQRIAHHDTPVLIIGESGTDKEAIARYLHRQSDRRHEPFISMSVSALSPTTAINEIYGEDAGHEIIHGLIDRAQSGALFIKDIADMDLKTQAHLQNTLQSRAYKRVNGASPVNMDARIMAATRHRLDDKVKAGAFRSDLYFQLNVVPVNVPPLRACYEDVPDILNYFVNDFVAREGLPYRHFTTAAQNRLRRYSWPGNTRELKNLVQRMLILGEDTSIELEEVELALGEQPPGRDDDDVSNFDLPLRRARENFEKAYLEYQLKQAHGSVSKIAKIAGMERTHLYRKLKSLGIDIKN